jgi:prevent-host-death family protein
MADLTVSKARQNLTKILKTVSAGERIVLHRHKKGVAALVPMEDLALLEEIEDRLDARAGRAAIREAEQKGTVPWEKVKADLRL